MRVKLKYFVLLFFFFNFFLISCGQSVEEGANAPDPDGQTPEEKPVLHVFTGAEQTDRYLPLLQGKFIAAMFNHTSVIGNTHMADTLLALQIGLKKIFTPEHGFRGLADAGEQLKDGTDVSTGLPVVSLYGSKKKPSAEDLAGIDLVLFDLQDVGVRFYTYISAMTYLMEACAENEIPILILDRPNPNGHFIDGPVLDPAFRSYVGMHPVPVVHGLTPGEFARMINGEGWLSKELKCELTVVPCENYDHLTPYELPVSPSPNLPNMRSIYLYPSICFFEGTQVSVGRGTDKQFQVIGAPGYPKGDFVFTPEPKPGAKSPKHNGVACRGYDLTTIDPETIRDWRALHLDHLLEFYRHYPDPEEFFLKNHFIDKLAGTDALRKMIMAGKTGEEVRSTWRDDLEAYKKMREGYLLYGDFK